MPPRSRDAGDNVSLREPQPSTPEQVGRPAKAESAPVSDTRTRSPWLTTLVAVWLVAPLLLIGSLTWISWQQTVAGPSEPLWVPAEDAGFVADRRIGISLTWAEPVAVVAPTWSGLVREVSVQNGAMLKSGDAVARIDGALRLAWHSATPFYRMLMIGSSGDDVASLNQLLRSRGLPAGDADVFTRDTRRGVSQLGADLGVGNNAGVFDPALIVYLPAAEVQVADVDLKVGLPAPSAGTTILSAAPTLASGTLTPAGSSGGDGVVPALIAANDESLVVGEQELELSDQRDELSPAALAALTPVVEAGQASLAAVLRRSLPDESVRLPTAAVHTAPDGSMCIAVQSETGYTIVAVSNLAGVGGETVVTGHVSPGDLVAIGLLVQGAPCN